MLLLAGTTNRLDGGKAGCHDSFFVLVAGRWGNVFLDSPFYRTSPIPPDPRWAVIS
jgi:hypothetical protein